MADQTCGSIRWENRKFCKNPETRIIDLIIFHKPVLRIYGLGAYANNKAPVWTKSFIEPIDLFDRSTATNKAVQAPGGFEGHVEGDIEKGTAEKSAVSIFLLIGTASCLCYTFAFQ